MWQEILVAIIGITVFGYLIWRIISLLTRKEAPSCAGCSKDCALKETPVDGCEEK